MWLTSMSARLTSTTMTESGTVSRISFRSEVVISLAELFGVGRASYQLDPEDMSTVVVVPAEGVVVIILTLRERDEVSKTQTRELGPCVFNSSSSPPVLMHVSDV